MNTIEALQKLYVALGGEAADVANLNITPEMISAIADIVEGGGAALPKVTTADNGKLLAVVRGAWDKVVKQNEVIIVNYNFVPADPEDHWESSLDYDTVRSYVESGRLVVARVESPYEEGTVYFVPTGGYNELGVVFSVAAPANSSNMNAISTMIIQHGYDGHNDVISVEMSMGYLSNSQ